MPWNMLRRRAVTLEEGTVVRVDLKFLFVRIVPRNGGIW